MILDGLDARVVANAAERLAAGELVGFPTETVYGLGARADDDAAVAGIFALKGRPVGHPLIVHVVDAAAAHGFAAVLPDVARRLIDAFWPGPLTVIVPRSAGRADVAAGGQPTVGLRSPAHPVARALLVAAAARGVAGVAAPSANRFGRVSPTTARHVESEFGAELPVLDGGACPIGIESTIIDCSRGHPVLLRPGTLGVARIEAATGLVLRSADAAAPRASGTLAAHYAPRARVRLMRSAMLADAVRLLGADAKGVAVYSRTPRPAGSLATWHVMPTDAAGTAHELFAVLRELDAPAVRLIWVEEPPPDAAWDGVRDRLQRAAAA